VGSRLCDEPDEDPLKACLMRSSTLGSRISNDTTECRSVKSGLKPVDGEASRSHWTLNVQAECQDGVSGAGDVRLPLTWI
jgi:hypothetical protein